MMELKCLMVVWGCLENFVMNKIKPMRLKQIGKNTTKSYTEWMKYIYKEVEKINKKKFNIK